VLEVKGAASAMLPLRNIGECLEGEEVVAIGAPMALGETVTKVSSAIAIATLKVPGSGSGISKPIRRLVRATAEALLFQNREKWLE